MNITVKDLPPATARVLKRRAAEQGRSLNREIIHILQQAAAEAERRREMRSRRGELDRFRASLGALASSVPLIRAQRERHY